MWWRVLIAIIVIFVVLSIIGAILSALKWLFGVAILVLIGGLIVGAIGRSKQP